MTNAEKFEQVFGFYPDIHICVIGDDSCPRKEDEYSCEDCPYIGFWMKEYEGEG